MTALSILDLVPVTEGSTPADALRNAQDLVQLAERLGFTRYWVAEHHNMAGIASAATAVVIGHLGQVTSRIRLGAGGIMLPNHAPLVIAEQFGTLAELYPGRIDLGLGRAPGTDQRTAQALRRTLRGTVDDFPQDVLELRNYLRPPQPGQAVVATPGAGTDIPLWILGSSLYGAGLAAQLGLPFAFASHFAPDYMEMAIALYRERFQPSEQLQAPYVMLGYNVFAADSDEQAQLLQTSMLQSFARLRRGQPGKMPPPLPGFAESLTAAERQGLAEMTRCTAVGSAETVAREMREFIAATGADELMLVSHIYDHQARRRCLELVAGLDL
ncbi:LLM class flavin-dependent oxidoreductase [Mangrovimicrobium sediminis]|uniref:Luciferase-like monooxygenase n=1 Tax=Mangrovimicrobium sediminis TaxID=2562682 RepID=A0A4Z0LX58_9GAMM|nr:LLM class flavin-dependent oxidoreductase [Haliea sp. SAOS-164]TGD71814.1 LLM class flavin-dependent oxidoreductase [Haliea sp. SAOS-164]